MGAGPVHEQAEAGPRRPRLLVVEDDGILQELYAMHFGAAGYDVLPARDGIEGYRLFEERHPDAILLDLNVPEISGFRLVRLFREAAPRIPIVVTTAYAFEEAEEVAHYRIDEFLTKPFDFDELVATVGRLGVRPAEKGTT